jgi:hypothetical protein
MAIKKTEGKAALKPIHILFDQELLGRVEEYRFAFRHQNRAEAIKALLLQALELNEKRAPKK